MGYYNQNYPPNPNRKKGRSWIPLVLGIVIGALLVIITVPRFFEMNEQAKNNLTRNNSNDSNTQQVVSLDVSTRITEIVSVVSPTVVGITNIQHRADFLEQQEDSEAGTGSGVIYKKDNRHAYVVTNHHVIEGADEIEVLLNDDTVLEARLLGTDLFSDLAVLRVDGSGINRTIEMGSSENLKVGEPVIAIGNPLGHMFSGSVTQGIISGTQRTIPQDFNFDGRADWQAEVIQTDAAINPGNSGGALINMDAQLIGINSMKINQEAVEGIGFSIPVDSARPIIDELEKTGQVKRPYLGVEIYSLEEVPRLEWEETLYLPKDVNGGVYVWSVDPLSPADKAGLDRLDVITHLDGKQIMNMIDLRKILYQEKDIGDEVALTYYHNGEKRTTTLILGVQR
ncbi:S1C family serine protease [Paucisalibacillus globulus]|uniref:S1C family serine protease n=1 Tax=Paucisalibacillus globulus TaxID=351095 RepID=UPI00041C81B9|nr:trypsin-like peptidase domain-containing protein [Paucisalibacillus globulus]